MTDLTKEDKRTVLQFLIQLMERALKEGALPVARMCNTCQFFNENPGGEVDAPYYCEFLEIPLDPETLRVDCEEQEPKTE